MERARTRACRKRRTFHPKEILYDRQILIAVIQTICWEAVFILVSTFPVISTHLANNGSDTLRYSSGRARHQAPDNYSGIHRPWSGLVVVPLLALLIRVCPLSVIFARLNFVVFHNRRRSSSCLRSVRWLSS